LPIEAAYGFEPVRVPAHSAIVSGVTPSWVKRAR
jgi:hypothetical protein